MVKLLTLLKGDVDKAAAMMNMKKEDFGNEVIRLRCIYDHEYYTEKRLWIQDKLGQVIPFKMRKGQKKLNDAYEKQKLSGKPIRLCTLKPRQGGWSTFFQSHLTKESIERHSRNSLTIAHSMESVEHLRGMSQRYYDRYNGDKPLLKKSTDKSWKYAHSFEKKDASSTMRIDTAENTSAGHSLTIQNLHASEIQLWPRPEELIRGIFPTIPNSPDTMIFMEGTGSGVGDYWYEFCEAARSGQNEWEFVFVAWHEIEDYQTEFVDGTLKAAFEKTLDEEEKRLRDEGVTLEQLNWRRNEINTSYRSDPDGFKQQYPDNPDEAFLTSGRPVFPAQTVKQNLGRSVLGNVGNFRHKNGSVVFDKDETGYWTLWEEPQAVQNLYCIGADPVEGKAIIASLGNRGGDKAAARVFRRDTRKFVATCHARLDPDVFAEELYMASLYFGCSILPEQNAGGGGQLLVARLIDKGARLLKTPVIGKKREIVKQDERGWETTRNSKRFLIDNMVEEIREGTYSDPDKRAWYECSTYVRDDKGSTNAQAQKFDDLVMATAITLQADRMLPVVFHATEEKKRLYARDEDVRENWKPTFRGNRQEVMETNYV